MDHELLMSTARGELKWAHRNLKHLDLPEDLQDRCQTRIIGGKNALNLSCLQRVRLYLSDRFKSGVIGFQMKIFREEKDLDREYVFDYSSNLEDKSFNYMMASTKGIPKATWTSWNLWMPAFKNMGLEKPGINFSPIKPRNDYIHRFRYGLADFPPGYLQPGREKLVKTVEDPLIGSNQKIWLREISLVLEDKGEDFVELDKISKDFQTVLETESALLVFSVASLLALLLSLVYLRKSIRVKVLSSLLMPTSIVLVFTSSHSVNFMEKILEMHLNRVRLQLENLVDFSEAQSHEFDRELFSSYQSERDYIRQLIHESVELGYGDHSIFDLNDEIDDIYSEAIQNFRVCHLFQLLLRPDFDLNAPINLDFKLTDSQVKTCSETKLRNVGHLFRHLYLQKFPTFQKLRSLEAKLGIRFAMSDGKRSFSSWRIGNGFKSINSLDRLLMQRAQYEANKEFDPVKLNLEYELEATRSMLELAENSGMPPGFLHDYLDRGILWSSIASNLRASNATRNAWDILQVDGVDWFVQPQVQQLGYIGKFVPHLEKVLPKTVSVHAVPEFGMPGYNYEQLPVRAMEHAVLVKESGESRFFTAYDSKGDLIAGVAFVLEKLPSFSLVFILPLGESLQSLVNAKLAFQIFMLILLLTPLTLAFLVAGIITSPLKQVQEGAQKIAEGMFNFRIKEPGRDELADLSKEFNKMAKQLQTGKEITSFLASHSRKEVLDSEKISRREEACIVFVGVHALPSELSTEFVEEFILTVQSVIHGSEGIVDKFTGDSILAVYTGENQGEQVLQMMNQLPEQLTSLRGRFRFGIGIARGSVVMGEIGASTRKDFTSIGNKVNLAARLKALSKDSLSECTIYLDSSMAQSMKGVTLKEIGEIPIKGKSELQRVFEFEWSLK